MPFCRPSVGEQDFQCSRVSVEQVDNQPVEAKLWGLIESPYSWTPDLSCMMLILGQAQLTDVHQ